MSAPVGNVNAMTHGVRRVTDAARKGFRQRRLPKGFRYVAGEVAEYVSGLVADVEGEGGTVDRSTKEIIEAAAAWQMVALYILKVMRDDSEQPTPELKLETRVQFATDFAKATQKRADLVKLLKLGRGSDTDGWSNLNNGDGTSVLQGPEDAEAAV